MGQPAEVFEQSLSKSEDSEAQVFSLCMCDTCSYRLDVGRWCEISARNLACGVHVRKAHEYIITDSWGIPGMYDINIYGTTRTAMFKV